MRLCAVTLCLLAVTCALCSGEGQCCRKLRTEMRRKIKLCSCNRNRECPIGFTRFKGVCYWFRLGHSDILDWWDAKNWCRDHGGSLVTINERRRAGFIKEYLQANLPYTGTPLKIHTGLIFTNAEAQYPYVPHNPRENPTSPTGDGLRWTSTRESVGLKHSPISATEKTAKWSPTVEGSYDGPSPHLFLSCVVIVWSPTVSTALTWRFNDCSETGLHLICEVRLRPHPPSPAPKARNRRSPRLSYRDILLAVHGLQVHTGLDMDGRQQEYQGHGGQQEYHGHGGQQEYHGHG